MADDRKVLILTTSLEAAERLAAPLKREGFEITAAVKAAEAIQSLRAQRHDLMVVDAAISRPSAVEFLAKAMQFLPGVLRTLYEETPGELDPRQIVNDASPCAIFTGAIDPGRVRRILERRQAVLQSAASQAVSAPTEAVGATAGHAKELLQLRSRIAFLERENARLHREGPAVPVQNSGSDALLAGRGALVDRARSDKAGGQGGAKTLDPEAASRKAREMAEKHPSRRIDLMKDDMAAEIARVIYVMLQEPEVRLPVLPQVGNELRKMTANENVSFEKIAEVVALDAGLSARIMEVANSALYAGADQIRSLSNAVLRIGMRETRNLVQAVVFENVFSTRDRRLAVVMSKLWMHSLAVAFGNEILARRLDIEASEDFFMMGLLHDIGKLAIIHLVEDGYQRKIWSRKTVSDEVLQELLILYHNDIGRHLLAGWEYPDPFQQVIQQHNDDVRIQERNEPVVVTYYSNLLTRKLGYSLRPHREDLLSNHDLAQALNMGDEVQGQIETDVKTTIDKVKRSFMRSA